MYTIKSEFLLGFHPWILNKPLSLLFHFFKIIFDSFNSTDQKEEVLCPIHK